MRTPPWRALRSSDVEERSGWYVTIILISPGMLLSAYFYGDHVSELVNDTRRYCVTQIRTMIFGEI